MADSSSWLSIGHTSALSFTLDQPSKYLVLSYIIIIAFIILCMPAQLHLLWCCRWRIMFPQECDDDMLNAVPISGPRGRLISAGVDHQAR